MTNLTAEDRFMKAALLQAKIAAKKDEVPVGAVVVRQGVIIGRGHNLTQCRGSVLAHAEIIALQKAAAKVGDWRLSDCELYVTLEPCAMCCGAAINSRIERIVFGAYDEKSGCCNGERDLTKSFHPNHTTQTSGGVLAEQCAQLLKDYFKGKRQKKD